MTSKEKAADLRRQANDLWDQGKRAADAGEYEKGRALKQASSTLHDQARELEAALDCESKGIITIRSDSYPEGFWDRIDLK